MKYVLYFIVWLLFAISYFIWEFKFLPFSINMFEDEDDEQGGFDVTY